MSVGGDRRTAGKNGRRVASGLGRGRRAGASCPLPLVALAIERTLVLLRNTDVVQSNHKASEVIVASDEALSGRLMQLSVIEL